MTVPGIEAGIIIIICDYMYACGGRCRMGRHDATVPIQQGVRDLLNIADTAE